MDADLNMFRNIFQSIGFMTYLLYYFYVLQKASI